MLRTLRLNLNKSGYYFIALALTAIAGFWPSYFGKLGGRSELTGYMHVHALMMTLWVGALIVQPILIKNKKLSVHRLIGKATYIVLPLVYLSVILLAHSRTKILSPEIWGINLFVPFKDLFIITVFYTIAIVYKNNSAIHGRAMIATGLACIEPALVRFVAYAIFPGSQGIEVYLVTLGIIYGIVVALMILERNQKSGRWVFPLLLLLFVTVHTLVILEMPVPLWVGFAKWFVSLPLT